MSESADHVLILLFAYLIELREPLAGLLQVFSSKLTVAEKHRIYLLTRMQEFGFCADYYLQGLGVDAAFFPPLHLCFNS